jgi:hypothetical protein
LSDPRRRSPKLLCRSLADPWLNRVRLSQAGRFAKLSAKAVPSRKIPAFQDLEYFGGAKRGGRKVLLTMFARQLFPSRRAIETFH